MQKSAQALVSNVASIMLEVADLTDKYNTATTAGGSGCETIAKQMKKRENDLESLRNQYHQMAVKMSDLESQANPVYLNVKERMEVDRENVDKWLSTMKMRMGSDEGLQADLKLIQHAGDEEAKTFQSLNQSQAAEQSQHLIEESLKMVEEEARLREENDALLAILYEREFAQQNQMDQYEDHMFHTFAAYKEAVEEHKLEMETHYRRLLQGSVMDSIKLTEDSQRLRKSLMKQQSSIRSRQMFENMAGLAVRSKKLGMALRFRKNFNARKNQAAAATEATPAPVPVASETMDAAIGEAVEAKE